ncbi:hypothetical protein, conserved in T. vivax [Trypanosoma vivax Y486]|uniref:Trypanosoma glutamic acid/alanine-rich protein domain-containing protein n=1 Tax=Trypanosoma vivax (strain Y486) TaxID=1055687 RepID=F9WS29_TRYVY|nr:hypothetical protein, conserved in T. vivax [Trypanosoma vivax Y486]|eukprot:CCD20367.1 hypothetical protein, conserved in T. vivax [Trypanosoma vivax Y486]
MQRTLLLVAALVSLRWRGAAASAGDGKAIVKEEAVKVCALAAALRDTADTAALVTREATTLTDTVRRGWHADTAARGRHLQVFSQAFTLTKGQMERHRAIAADAAGARAVAKVRDMHELPLRLQRLADTAAALHSHASAQGQELTALLKTLADYRDASSGNWGCIVEDDSGTRAAKATIDGALAACLARSNKETIVAAETVTAALKAVEKTQSILKGTASTTKCTLTNSGEASSGSLPDRTATSFSTFYTITGGGSAASTLTWAATKTKTLEAIAAQHTQLLALKAEVEEACSEVEGIKHTARGALCSAETSTAAINALAAAAEAALAKVFGSEVAASKNATCHKAHAQATAQAGTKGDQPQQHGNAAAKLGEQHGTLPHDGQQAATKRLDAAVRHGRGAAVAATVAAAITQAMRRGDTR